MRFLWYKSTKYISIKKIFLCIFWIYTFVFSWRIFLHGYYFFHQLISLSCHTPKPINSSSPYSISHFGQGHSPILHALSSCSTSSNTGNHLSRIFERKLHFHNLPSPNISVIFLLWALSLWSPNSLTPCILSIKKFATRL